MFEINVLEINVNDAQDYLNVIGQKTEDFFWEKVDAMLDKEMKVEEILFKMEERFSKKEISQILNKDHKEVICNKSVGVFIKNMHERNYDDRVTRWVIERSPILS